MRRAFAPVLLGVLLSVVLSARAQAYVYWVNGSDASTTIARGNNDGSALNASFIPVASGTELLAIDDRFVFWAGAGGSIGRANIGGSSVTPAFLTGQGNVTGLTTAGRTLYWATSDGRLHSADDDGGHENDAVLTEDDGFFSTQLTSSGSSYLFRERFQNGNAASADLFRTDLAGGSSDGGHLVSPDSHNAILQGLTADADHLYAIRQGIGPGGDATYPITVGGLDAASFSALVPGDGAPKAGLAQAGCRLWWSNRALGAGGGNQPIAAAINTALIDGTGVHTKLMTAGVVAPGAVAADLLPAEAGDCGHVSAPPSSPPITDPTPPTPAPSPTPAPTTPTPVSIGSSADLLALSGQQLQTLDNLLGAYVASLGGVLTPALQAASYRIDREFTRRMLIGFDICAQGLCPTLQALDAQTQSDSRSFTAPLGPISVAEPRAATRKHAAPLLFSGVAGGQDARTSTVTAAALTADLVADRRTQAALAAARTRLAKLTRAHEKLTAARAALKRADAAVAARRLQTVKIRPSSAGAPAIRALRRKLARGRSVKLVMVVLLKDPRSGKTAASQHAFTLRPRAH